VSAIPFEESYVGNLRKYVGAQRIITPGPRAVIVDDSGSVLLVRRTDDSTWVMPAGGLAAHQDVYRETRADLDAFDGTMILK
jgi:8-oxo-dGTP pyrophosphatase MutT (NUDIX family)